MIVAMSFDRSTPPARPSRSGSGPRTIAGYGLKALARHDLRAAKALPDDPLPECTLAIIDNAFAIAVLELFGESPDPERIALLARGVSRLSLTPPIAAGISADDVETLVLAEFTGSAGEPERATEIKVATFLRIVHDLGLSDPEIDDLIIMAEAIAEEDGCELSLLDGG